MTTQQTRSQLQLQFTTFFSQQPSPSGSSCMPNPPKRRGPMCGLVNTKNADNKCFLFCYARYLSYLAQGNMKDPQRIKKKEKRSANSLEYGDIDVSAKTEEISIIEERLNIKIRAIAWLQPCKIFTLPIICRHFHHLHQHNGFFTSGRWYSPKLHPQNRFIGILSMN